MQQTETEMLAAAASSSSSQAVDSIRLTEKRDMTFLCPFSLRNSTTLWHCANILAQTVKDKANHAVVLDKATADKLQKDVQSYRLITVAVLVDRLKINGSLARQALKDLEEKGLIKKVVAHSSMRVYSE